MSHSALFSHNVEGWVELDSAISWDRFLSAVYMHARCEL